VSDVAEGYVELGLRLGRHVDALVDAYYGPSELAERVAAEDTRAPTELVHDAVALVYALDGPALEGTRRNWLRAQLVGLETVARRLAGGAIPFAEEVERCYGVRPERVPEERFEAAHQALDEALPGSGPVAQRYQGWREGNPVPTESLPDVVESLRDDLKGRTLELFGLPDGESVSFEYVSDEPWSAYNYYLGGLRSRISVNTDVPMTPTFLVEVVSHETYPGHHTEHASKEQLLVREQGRLEESISMIGTPQSLIAEGIAGLAVEMALGGEEQEVTAAHVSGTGVDYDPEVSGPFRRRRGSSRASRRTSRSCSTPTAARATRRTHISCAGASRRSSVPTRRCASIPIPSGGRTRRPTRTATGFAARSWTAIPRGSNACSPSSSRRRISSTLE
jgi:hypothetical protein